MEKLDKVHVRVMRIITGATQRSNVQTMYEDLACVSRHLIHRLTLFYKITNNMTPQYLAEIVSRSGVSEHHEERTMTF